MPKQGRRHGTRSCHVGGCRRPECVEANRQYLHAYWLERKAYVPRKEELVDPARAIAHIEALRAKGMGRGPIAEAAGMLKSSIWYLDHGVRTSIRADTERRILAVRFEPRAIPATGTMRRLQALSALGFTFDDIGTRVGIAAGTVGQIARGMRVIVTHTTADSVAKVYAELSMSVGPSDRARNRAVSKGWAPPLAWDEDTIDDPGAEPAGVPSRPTHLRSYGLDLDEWLFLVRAGELPERAAERCGVQLTTVDRLARRHGRAAEYVAALHYNERAVA